MTTTTMFSSDVRAFESQGTRDIEETASRQIDRRRYRRNVLTGLALETDV